LWKKPLIFGVYAGFELTKVSLGTEAVRIYLFPGAKKNIQIIISLRCIPSITLSGLRHECLQGLVEHLVRLIFLVKIDTKIQPLLCW
jgi:hypothetical protein